MCVCLYKPVINGHTLIEVENCENCENGENCENVVNLKISASLSVYFGV